MKEKVIEKINKYLTKQFICNPSEVPDDECRSEAEAILNLEWENGVKMLAIVDRIGKVIE